ncbi:MAG: hypothetical protein ACE5IO_07725 [Thermoplasmata archaeon]
MNAETLRKLAFSFMLVVLVIIPVLLYFMVQSFLAKEYPEAAFLIGICFILVAQLIYYYEKAFTPAEIWWTRKSLMVRPIEKNSVEEELDLPEGEKS